MASKVQDQELLLVLSQGADQLPGFGTGEWYIPQVGEGCQNVQQAVVLLFQMTQVSFIVAIGKGCKDDQQLGHGGSWVVLGKCGEKLWDMQKCCPITNLSV